MDDLVQHPAQGGGILVLNSLMQTVQTKRLDSGFLILGEANGTADPGHTQGLYR